MASVMPCPLTGAWRQAPGRGPALGPVALALALAFLPALDAKTSSFANIPRGYTPEQAKDYKAVVGKLEAKWDLLSNQHLVLKADVNPLKAAKLLNKLDEEKGRLEKGGKVRKVSIFALSKEDYDQYCNRAAKWYAEGKGPQPFPTLGGRFDSNWLTAEQQRPDDDGNSIFRVFDNLGDIEIHPMDVSENTKNHSSDSVHSFRTITKKKDWFLKLFRDRDPFQWSDAVHDVEYIVDPMSPDDRKRALLKKGRKKASDEEEKPKEPVVPEDLIPNLVNIEKWIHAILRERETNQYNVAHFMSSNKGKELQAYHKLCKKHGIAPKVPFREKRHDEL